jgi:sugar O-acyltransferase (sialic acid O-acetyltransferase NeuD family)
MAERLVVFGSGGHAKVVAEAVLARTPHCDIILLDDSPGAHDRRILGIPVRGGRDELERSRGAPVALGIGDNQSRSSLIAWLTEQGHPLETIIHPAATIGASVQIGAGAFLAAGAIAIADAWIGRGAIINTGASVDHDCVVGETAHIGPGVRLCGEVSVGPRTLVGVGTAVRPRIRIGSDCVIGAGSAVVCDLPDGGNYAGCPARPIRGGSGPC